MEAWVVWILQILVVTVAGSELYLKKMRIISKHRWERLLPFEKMDLSIPGGSRFLVVTHSSELAHQSWHQSNRIPIGLELFLIFGLFFFFFLSGFVCFFVFILRK